MLNRYQVLVLQGIMLIIYAIKGAKTNDNEKAWIDAINKAIDNKERN